MKKENEEGIRRQKDLLWSWIHRINIAKMANFIKSKLQIQSPSNLQLNSLQIFKDNFKLHMKTWKTYGCLKQSWMVKELLKLPQPPPQAVLHHSRTKNTTSLAQNRHVHLWANTEEANMNAHAMNSLFLLRKAKMHTGKKASSTNVAGQHGQLHVEQFK